jgi:hypothetical protein
MYIKGWKQQSYPSYKTESYSKRLPEYKRSTYFITM